MHNGIAMALQVTCADLQDAAGVSLFGSNRLMWCMTEMEEAALFGGVRKHIHSPRDASRNDNVNTFGSRYTKTARAAHS